MLNTMPSTLEDSLPMMLPTQYPIRYIAATVVFFVVPATLLEIKLSNATKGVGEACVR
jgi:hypothetical protein